MKRVHLWKDEPSVDLLTLRIAAVELASFAVEEGKLAGAPVHEWVTEGRRTQYERAVSNGAPWALQMSPYSSCGDLAHWLLTMLGCRDESIVNRTDDGGKISWKPGPNISRLVNSKYYTRGHAVSPKHGDIFHVAAPHHVAVLLHTVDDSKWITADYGQPYGKTHACEVRHTTRVTYVRGRPIQGFVCLEKMESDHAFTESAIVPNSFKLGVPDDNPYPELGIKVPGF